MRWLALAALLCCATSAAAASRALISGRLLGPDGMPAAGFLVLAQDVFSGREVGSAQTGDDGSYRIHVPAGSRYRLFAAVGPDGTRLAVDPRPEVDVPVAGEFVAPDVSWSRRAPDTPGAAVGPPWYRSTAAVSGFAAGGVALLVLVLEDGDGEQRASPSAP